MERHAARRDAVVVLIALAASNLFSAVAPNYELLVAARVFGGLTHAMFWIIVAAYAGHQFGLIEHTDAAYSWMNLVGSLVLAIIAYRGQLWGFLLLEAVWAAVSVPPLLRSRPSRPST